MGLFKPNIEKMKAERDVKGAEEELNRRLITTTERYKRARLHSDRGYIRTSLKKNPLARRDLQSS